MPSLAAAVIASAYLIVAPRSEDLAAHLLRARLFTAEGFGIWNNWWYAGHNVPGYSVLFPALGALLTPQLAAALATVPTAALFESLVHRRFGADSWLGALWFGVATSTNLFTGRLTFALGLLPAVGTALALQRGRPRLAVALAALTALASPVDALFAALAGAAQAVGALIDARPADPGTGRRDREPLADHQPLAHEQPVTHDQPHAHDQPLAHHGPLARLRPALPGMAVVLAAALPVLALTVAFPEGGVEPFALSAFWPIVLVSIAGALAIPSWDVALRAGAALYALGCLGAYAVTSPVGSNMTRLGALMAGPLAALLWWPRRKLALLAVALPLLYLQWQAPVRDVRTAAENREVSTAYFKPVIDYLRRQPGAPFRIEIPFTQFHWEAYLLAPHFALARGWERQLDVKDNGLFYDGSLNAQRYDAWLHELGVRFVAVADAQLDYSAKREAALIERGLPYLHLVLATRDWRIYAVKDPTPIVQGAATLSGLGANWMTLQARSAGSALIRVRFSPYWAITRGSGCVAPAGAFTRLVVRRPGPVRLAIRFSLGRIGATSARCN